MTILTRGSRQVPAGSARPAAALRADAPSDGHCIGAARGLSASSRALVSRMRKPRPPGGSANASTRRSCENSERPPPSATKSSSSLKPLVGSAEQPRRMLVGTVTPEMIAEASSTWLRLHDSRELARPMPVEKPTPELPRKSAAMIEWPSALSVKSSSAVTPRGCIRPTSRLSRRSYTSTECDGESDSLMYSSARFWSMNAPSVPNAPVMTARTAPVRGSTRYTTPLRGTNAPWFATYSSPLLSCTASPSPRHRRSSVATIE
mmetsp:Transcript_5762/g.18117  ORF Transcript_5762/g.18117 Transcript_5762/m.18117 type:complete len:262 (-) Transcript_5762:525-1310(-)